MPQIQVLPYVQSPLEQLTPYLAQAGQAIGQGLARRGANRRDQAIINQVASGNMSPMEQLTALYGLSDPQKGIALMSAVQKNQANMAEEQAKRQVQVQEQQQVKQAFDRLDELSSKVSRFTYKYSPEAIADAEELDSLGLMIADKAWAKINKGMLQKVKFDALMKTLKPGSDLLESQNKARLRALKQMEGLPPDISQEKFDAFAKTVTKEVEQEDKRAKGKGTGEMKSLKDIFQ